MKFKGRMQKDGRYWAVWVESLNVFTQGKSKSDAYFMIKDAIKELMADRDFALNIESISSGEFYVSSPDSKRLVGFALQRNKDKRDLTYEDLRKKLDAKSRNEFRAYESGKTDPTLSKLEKLLNVVGLSIAIVPKDAKDEEKEERLRA